MSYERLLDKGHRPSEEEILNTIDQTAAWLDLRQYIEENYDFASELAFFAKKYGWTVRYRKSGKTLISLFPEYGAFTALVVLGKKEGEKVAEMLAELSSTTSDLIGSAKQLHDGKWLWIRVLEPSHVEDVKRLLAAKRKPIANSS